MKKSKEYYWVRLSFGGPQTTVISKIILHHPQEPFFGPVGDVTPLRMKALNTII